MKPITTVRSKLTMVAFALIAASAWHLTETPLFGQQSVTVSNNYLTRNRRNGIATVEVGSQNPTNPAQPSRSVRIQPKDKEAIPLDGTDPYWIRVKVDNHTFKSPPLMLKKHLAANPRLELKLSEMKAAPGPGFGPPGLKIPVQLGLSFEGNEQFLQGMQILASGEQATLRIDNQLPFKSPDRILVGSRAYSGTKANWVPVALRDGIGTIELASDDPFGIWVEWGGSDYESVPIPLKGVFFSTPNGRGTVVVEKAGTDDAQRIRIRVKEDDLSIEPFSELGKVYAEWFCNPNVNVFDQKLLPRPHDKPLAELGYRLDAW